MILNIFISKNKHNIENNISIDKNNIILGINIGDNFQVENIINKLDRHLTIYNLMTINITFDKSYKSSNIMYIISKLDNIFYSFNPSKTKIIYHNIDDSVNIYIKYLKSYKDIVMETDKNPETYLQYIKKNLPKGYKIEIHKLKTNDKMFPLTSAVGQGSQYNSYFVYIQKEKQNKTCKNIVFIGKSITYDSGGLNLKFKEIETMKIDMTGSALLLNVLNLLVDTKKDNNNIHLLFPIAENMIGNTAVRPGMVVKTLNGTMVEITDTDAEGRLTIVDAIEYFNKFIKKKLEKPILVDISTLTNTGRLVSFGGIIMCNKMGEKNTKKLIKIGSKFGEYLQKIEYRDEYNIFLESNVADIRNYASNCSVDTIYAGTFTKYFVDKDSEYIHVDIGCSTYNNNKINSYGILLLYKFLKKLIN
jgi:leucyl aminopeptidase